MQKILLEYQDQRETIGSQLVHRSLSTDDFEKTQLNKFWNLKKSLGLTIESFLEDQQDLKIARLALEEFYVNGSKTYTLEQIKKENGRPDCFNA